MNTMTAAREGKITQNECPKFATKTTKIKRNAHQNFDAHSQQTPLHIKETLLYKSPLVQRRRPQKKNKKPTGRWSTELKERMGELSPHAENTPRQQKGCAPCGDSPYHRKGSKWWVAGQKHRGKESTVNNAAVHGTPVTVYPSAQDYSGIRPIYSYKSPNAVAKAPNSYQGSHENADH
jgi:hypothetical protein